MNTAAGLMSASPLQMLQQSPADAAAPAAAGGGDFAAALAAACTAEQPDNSLPDGMQSAAALAWLAGLAGLTASPGAGPAGASTAVKASATEDSSDTDAAVPDAINAMMLAGLQGFVQPVAVEAADAAPVASGTATSGDSSGTAGLVIGADQAAVTTSAAAAAASAAIAATTAVAGAASTPAKAAAVTSATTAATAAVAADAAKVAPTAVDTAASAATASAVAADATPAVTAEVAAALPGVINLPAGNAAGRTSGTASSSTGGVSARPVSSLALIRTLAAPLQDAPAVQSDATTAPPEAEITLKADTPADSIMTAEKLSAAIPERASVTAGADIDQPVISGVNAYADTRDTTAASQAGPSATIHSTVGSPRWGNELGSRLVMMSMQGQQEGSLSLTPEHLGPLEVRISVSQDGTNVWFGAQHADTRAALTEALPRLREMFSASGLALGHAGVSQQMPQQQARRGEFTAATNDAGSAEVADSAPVAPVVRQVRSALLDTWA